MCETEKEKKKKKGEETSLQYPVFFFFFGPSVMWTFVNFLGGEVDMYLFFFFQM